MNRKNATPSKNMPLPAQAPEIKALPGKGKGKAPVLQASKNTGAGKIAPSNNNSMMSARTNSSSKAGLQFSISRTARFMK